MGPFIAWLCSAVGGILLFLFLVRRRSRDDDPTLATVAPEDAQPVAADAAAAAAVILSPPSTDGDPGAAEDAKPKTRRKRTRPAVAAGAVATGAVATTESAFAKPPVTGVERVFVSGRSVPMLATPDAVRPMGSRLQRGDEVEIIDSHEGHLNVRTPGGVSGWIPRTSVSSSPPRTLLGSTPVTT